MFYLFNNQSKKMLHKCVKSVTKLIVLIDNKKLELVF